MRCVVTVVFVLAVLCASAHAQGLYGAASLNRDPNLATGASNPLGPAVLNTNAGASGPYGTTFTPGVQYVNGQPVSTQQQFVNGQPVSYVNGQAFINGIQVQFVNGQPVHFVNGVAVPVGIPYPGVDQNSPLDPFTGYVNDTLEGNPYAPAFQNSAANPASAAPATDGMTGEKGPAVTVYGPAQNFWDKHPADSKLVPLFRYWNPAIRDHFYTIDFGVFGSGREGWVYQGIQCYVYPSQESGTVPLYRYWNLKLLDDYYTVSANVSEETGYKLKGIAAYVAPTELPGTVPLFRYWNQELADHYYTHNFNVMSNGRDGWVLQGIACYVWPHPSEYIPFVNNTSPDATIPGQLLTPTMYVPPVGEANENHTEPEAIPPTTPAPAAQASTDTPLLVPLYRYWNSVYRDHFYTTLWSEVFSGGRDGWEYQGVQALVYANPQPGTVALHRYWNIRTLDHFYTTNFAALEKGGKDGWVYEGIQCYVEPQKTDSNVPLYRYYSDLYKDHFYTTRFIGNEARTWVFEGIQGYVFPSFFTDC